jgi:DNA-binding MarR family transcriptional regulator
MSDARAMLDDLPFCVNRAAFSFRRFSDSTLRAVGLAPQPPGLAVVLHTLHAWGACTVQRLVEATHLANGTLTGLLDALERDGHVRRMAHATDGRSWVVKITAKGRRLCARLERRHEIVMALFRQTLTRDESAELARLLGKLTTAMRTYAAGQDQPARTGRTNRPISRKTQRQRAVPAAAIARAPHRTRRTLRSSFHHPTRQ